MPRVVEHHTRSSRTTRAWPSPSRWRSPSPGSAYKLGGLADVTGAFLAGVMLSRTDLGHASPRRFRGSSYSLFIPIFFVFIGSYVTADDLLAAPGSGRGRDLVALATKLFGCGAPRSPAANPRRPRCASARAWSAAAKSRSSWRRSG